MAIFCIYVKFLGCIHFCCYCKSQRFRNIPGAFCRIARCEVALMNKIDELLGVKQIPKGPLKKVTCIPSIYDNLPGYFKLHPQHKHGTPKNGDLENFMFLFKGVIFRLCYFWWGVVRGVLSKVESLSFGIPSPTYSPRLCRLWQAKVFIPILGAKGGRMVTFHEPLLPIKNTDLSGGFKHLLCSPLLGEMIQFD